MCVNCYRKVCVHSKLDASEKLRQGHVHCVASPVTTFCKCLGTKETSFLSLESETLPHSCLGKNFSTSAVQISRVVVFCVMICRISRDENWDFKHASLAAGLLFNRAMLFKYVQHGAWCCQAEVKSSFRIKLKAWCLSMI